MLWARLAQFPMAMLVIETAFGDDERALPEISKHVYPADLQAELAQLSTPTDVYLTQIKPGEVDAVMSEIAAQGRRHRVRALAPGDVMDLAAQFFG